MHARNRKLFKKMKTVTKDLFKPKPYIKIGKTNAIIYIPKPPKHATHAVLTCQNQLTQNGEPKKAILPIRDFDCFRGVSGDFSYIRMDNKRNIKEEYEGKWFWDGFSVPEIKELINEN